MYQSRPARVISVKFNLQASRLLWQYLRMITHRVQTGLKPHPQIKNVIAIASGKGGVGKSTTCVNLALALAKQGVKVGILDADIYGPNIAHILGDTDTISEPPSTEGIAPIVLHGIQTMSIAYMIDEDTPMIWRGPMVSRALTQLFFHTQWSDLDCLLIDLPPGTGDIQLTLSKNIPLVGAVVVCTPQDIALLDAKKAIAMFNKLSIPLLGMLENMAYHTCPQCDHVSHIFGEQGLLELAESMDVPMLGCLPLDISLRVAADLGQPLLLSKPESSLNAIYSAAATALLAALKKLPKDYQANMPGVSVE